MNGDGQDVVVITDTSVLVNFLCIDRMDLIARHPHRFMITGHVMKEITDHYPEQQARLNAALADGTLELVTVCGDAALDLFRILSETGRLGAGKSAAIACAMANNYAIAIDDRAGAAQARQMKVDLVVLGSQDIMVHLIRSGAIEVGEADDIKNKVRDHPSMTGVVDMGMKAPAGPAWIATAAFATSRAIRDIRSITS
jgi:predicted nucleic acid-binding protein